MSANDEWFKKKYESSYNFNKNAETITGKGEIPPNVSPFEKVGEAENFGGTSSFSGMNGGLRNSGSFCNFPSTSGYNPQKRF
jgi:hypothetical protein